MTAYERNTNICRFIFSTPFTPDGSPHGDLAEQYKRKTILTTVNHFPYIKTRIQVRNCIIRIMYVLLTIASLLRLLSRSKLS